MSPIEAVHGKSLAEKGASRLMKPGPPTRLDIDFVLHAVRAGAFLQEVGGASYEKCGTRTVGQVVKPGPKMPLSDRSLLTHQLRVH